MRRRTGAKMLAMVLALILGIGTLSGCGKTITDADYEEMLAQKTKSNRETTALYVTKGDVKHEISMDWMVYFLAYYENQGMEYYQENKDYFDTMYGQEYNYWALSTSGGESMAVTYKNAAFSAAVYTYIMYFEAVEAGVQLDDARAKKLDSTTEKFLSGYTLAERARCGMSTDTIRETYERIFLVTAFEEQLKKDQTIDREEIAATVDKDDYLVYVTDYLYVSKSAYDENMHKVELTEEQQKERKDAITDALERAGKGEDMQTIRNAYDDIMTFSTRDFYRTDKMIEPSYIEMAQKMEKDAVQFLETEAGYYVIKMVDNEQIIGYEDAVEEAVATAEAKDTSEIYEAYEKQYTVDKAEAFDNVIMGQFAKEQ